MKRVLAILVIGLLLVGCASTEEKEEARAAIQAAVQQTETLNQAQVQMSVMVETANDSFYQETSGTFLRKITNQRDWHFVSYRPGRNQLVSYELVQIDGNQYQKVIRDPLEKANWEEITPPVVTYYDLFIEPIEWVVEIEEMRQLSKEEKADETWYEIVIESDTYDSFRSKNQEATELHLEEIGRETYSPSMQQWISLQMDRMASMEIEEATLLYVVDHDQYLKQVRYKTDSVLPNGEWIRVEHIYYLEEEVEDPSQLIPSVSL